MYTHKNASASIHTHAKMHISILLTDIHTHTVIHTSAYTYTHIVSPHLCCGDAECTVLLMMTHVKNGGQIFNVVCVDGSGQSDM